VRLPVIYVSYEHVYSQEAQYIKKLNLLGLYMLLERYEPMVRMMLYIN